MLVNNRFRRPLVTALASLGLAVGMVAAGGNVASAVSPPVITPSGPLTDFAAVQVDVSGLIPGNAYAVSICDGPHRGDTPNCDTDPQYSRSFYTDETSATLRFPVRKQFANRSATVNCQGEAGGSVCYMVIRQHGNEREVTAETRVRFV